MSKPKRNYVPGGQDLCQTPSYALDALASFIHWVVITHRMPIWESACGDGLLSRCLLELGYSVIETDLLRGQDFFEWQPDDWGCQITNPPFSLKYQWLERSYELQKPFALLLPVETLGAAKAQRLLQAYGANIVLMDTRIDFKMPNKGWQGSAQFPVMWWLWFGPQWDTKSELKYFDAGITCESIKEAKALWKKQTP